MQSRLAAAIRIRQEIKLHDVLVDILQRHWNLKDVVTTYVLCGTISEVLGCSRNFLDAYRIACLLQRAAHGWDHGSHEERYPATSTMLPPFRQIDGSTSLGLDGGLMGWPQYPVASTTVASELGVGMSNFERV